MKTAFRLYRRKKVYYCEDNETGQQESLHTSDKAEAVRLLNAKNEPAHVGVISLQIASAYMGAVDPQMASRTWDDVISFIIGQHKEGPTRARWENVKRDKGLKKLWKLKIARTRPDQLLNILKDGTVATNVFLRRLHNFACDMKWLAWPILGRRQWPKVVYGEKRGITEEEHHKIIARERNPERRDYYELLWELGGSQTDIAWFHAEDIDGKDRTIFYRRKKNGRDAMPRFGDRAAAILARRPKSGPLFPYLIKLRESDQATEFKQRCDGLGIKGVTLHSYRYGWAERAVTCGYPERHAQTNLGHGSKAFARVYGRKAKVKTPPLEDYEKAHHNGASKISSFPPDVDVEGQRLVESQAVATKGTPQLPAPAAVS